MKIVEMRCQEKYISGVSFIKTEENSQNLLSNQITNKNPPHLLNIAPFDIKFKFKEVWKKGHHKN